MGGLGAKVVRVVSQLPDIIVGFSDFLSVGDFGMAGLAMLPDLDNCCSRIYAQQSRVSWHVDGA